MPQEQKPESKVNVTEGIGYVFVSAGAAALGLVISGPVLAAALGLLVAGAVLILAGNV